MFNFSIEAPSNLSGFFFPYFILFFYFPSNSCLQGHHSEMCESYQLLAIIIGRANKRDIRTKTGGKEIARVEALVENDGDGVEEEGIERKIKVVCKE